MQNNNHEINRRYSVVSLSRLKIDERPVQFILRARQVEGTNHILIRESEEENDNEIFQFNSVINRFFEILENSEIDELRVFGSEFETDSEGNINRIYRDEQVLRPIEQDFWDEPTRNNFSEGLSRNSTYFINSLVINQSVSVNLIVGIIHKCANLRSIMVRGFNCKFPGRRLDFIIKTVPAVRRERRFQISGLLEPISYSYDYSELQRQLPQRFSARMLPIGTEFAFLKKYKYCCMELENFNMADGKMLICSNLKNGFHFIVAPENGVFEETPFSKFLAGENLPEISELYDKSEEEKDEYISIRKNWCDLPVEMMLKCVNYMELVTRAKMSLTCRRMKRIVDISKIVVEMLEIWNVMGNAPVLEVIARFYRNRTVSKSCFTENFDIFNSKIDNYDITFRLATHVLKMGIIEQLSVVEQWMDTYTVRRMHEEFPLLPPFRVQKLVIRSDNPETVKMLCNQCADQLDTIEIIVNNNRRFVWTEQVMKEVLSLQKVKTAKQVQIKMENNLNISSIAPYLAYKWINNDAPIGTSLVLHTFMRTIDEFRGWHRTRFVHRKTNDPNFCRISTENPAKHIMFQSIGFETFLIVIDSQQKKKDVVMPEWKRLLRRNR